MTNDLPIENFMQRHLLECTPQTPVADAARMMRDARCGSILVVDVAKTVGIWTESDALAMAWDAPDVLDQPICNFMSSPVQILAPSATLGEAAFLMRSAAIHHMVVGHVGERPQGMISQTDVIRNQGVEFFVHLREVGSVIERAPLTMTAATPLADARRQMSAVHCNALVVAEGGTRLGIITTRDVLRAVAERRLDATVGEIASFPLLTLPRSASLLAARRMFLDHDIRHLGVSEAGDVVGLLSFDDIMGSVEESYIRELRAELREQTELLRRSERQIKQQASSTDAILDALPISVVVKDAAGKIIVANRMAADAMGKPRTAVIGHTDHELLNAGMARRHAEDDARAKASGRMLVSEVIAADGRALIEHRRAVGSGGEAMLISAAIDVTDWKRADALMVSSHDVLELIAGGAELPVVLNAICQRMENHLPQSMCSILLLEDGRLRNGAAPSLPEAYVRGIDGVAIGPEVGSCGAAAFSGEPMMVADIAASPLWQKGGAHALKHGLRACWSTPFFSSDRRVLGTFAIYFAEPRTAGDADLEVIAHATRLASVAVERWQQISDLRRLATTDLLTGLMNRAAFLDEADEELRRARRFNRLPVLLMIDLDRFKNINDDFGHAAGDEALRAFATVFRDTLRGVDALGRLGGEEFAALLPETDLAGGVMVAERLRAAVEAVEVGLDGGDTFSFTASIGVAMPHAEEPLDRLLARADAALYVAKDRGRNRVESAESASARGA